MKILKTRDIQKYIKLLRTPYTEANKILFMAWAVEHLDNLDLKLTNLELVIEGYSHIIQLYSDWLRAENTPDEAEVKIAQTIQDVSADVNQFFQQLEGVKKEKETYLSNSFWKEIGGIPKRAERECVLKAETLQMFFPTQSINGHPARSFGSHFKIKHH